MFLCLLLWCVATPAHAQRCTGTNVFCSLVLSSGSPLCTEAGCSLTASGCAGPSRKTCANITVADACSAVRCTWINATAAPSPVATSAVTVTARDTVATKGTTVEPPNAEPETSDQADLVVVISVCAVVGAIFLLLVAWFVCLRPRCWLPSQRLSSEMRPRFFAVVIVMFTLNYCCCLCLCRKFQRPLMRRTRNFFFGTETHDRDRPTVQVMSASEDVSESREFHDCLSEIDVSETEV
jgi:hypothetical protein